MFNDRLYKYSGAGRPTNQVFYSTNELIELYVLHVRMHLANLTPAELWETNHCNIAVIIGAENVSCC